jgi:GNAT superfamily N-acetyltransferase
MEIRLFKKSDAKQVAQLLNNSVKIPDPQGFSEADVQPGTPNIIPLQDWEKTFLNKFTVVAEVDHTIIGIAQLEKTGHINCFYCHQDFRRQGIGGKLYAALEDYALSKHIPVLHTEASTSDCPFFVQMGFQKVQKQKVLIRGEVKESFVMEKKIFH